MIIGITGTLATGKSTVAKILVEKGFKHYSVRDFLVQEITRRGVGVTRDNMVEVAKQAEQDAILQTSKQDMQDSVEKLRVEKEKAAKKS